MPSQAITMFTFFLAYELRIRSATSSKAIKVETSKQVQLKNDHHYNINLTKIIVNEMIYDILQQHRSRISQTNELYESNITHDVTQVLRKTVSKFTSIFAN